MLNFDMWNNNYWLGMTPSSILLRLLRKVFHSSPSLQPIMNKIYQRNFRYKPKFMGWGMITAHQLPWNDENDWEKFEESCKYVKNNFNFGNNSTGIQKYNVDDLMWRHWIISFCSRYAKNFVKTDYYNFVECGSGIGISSFFILTEFFNNDNKKHFQFHLYD